MKKYSIILAISSLSLFYSCGEDFLTVYPTEQQEAGAPATERAIMANLTSCYQILLFDSYADNNYNSIPLVSGLRADEIYKGGSDAGDQGALYRLSQLDATATELPAGLWKIFYTGLSRCNGVFDACDDAVNVNETSLSKMKAEAHFLRAYYTHWLWKFWGNIPYFKTELKAPYFAKQYNADEIYSEIMADLDFAIEGEELPMRTTSENDGRATKAAAMLLRARVVMYQKDQSRYSQVLSDMAEIVNSGKYKLMPDFAAIWLDSGEFCDESIFESNQLPEGKTWASGWQGYGTNLPAFISPSELKNNSPLKGGWGFGPVRSEAYKMYDATDARRNASINHFADGDYSPRFQNTGYFMGKYAARDGYNKTTGDNDLNYKNNFRIFRYAEVLLNAAELMAIHNVAPIGGLSAQSCLDQVRLRALQPSIPATEENIKLERRKEFFGEGIRFWDIVRWGDTNILNENNTEFSSVRTWAEHKKYLPIPQSDIDKTEGEFKLIQNPGY